MDFIRRYYQDKIEEGDHSVASSDWLPAQVRGRISVAVGLVGGYMKLITESEFQEAAGEIQLDKVAKVITAPKNHIAK